jgi:glycosyltransferase involved in cell wall biosynthesis
VRTIVFGGEGDGAHCAARTLRSLQRAGLAADNAGSMPAVLGEMLAAAGDAAWLVRAGAWRPGRGPITFPPSSRTGRPLCALGAIVPRAASPDADETAWAETLAVTGGDLDGKRLSPLPPLASVFLEPALARALGESLKGGAPIDAALEAVLRAHQARVIRYAPLDVHAGRELRVAQIVTSLQQGGAERVALSLAAALPGLEVPTLLVALGGPTRASFAAPAGTLDLSWQRHLDREARMAPLLEAVAAFGADVVHAHLLEGSEVVRLGGSGLPVVLTIHNVREAWPAGTAELRASDAALVVACAGAVEAELRAAALAPPLRTVWNGVDFGPFAPVPATRARGRAWRTRLGVGPDSLLLVAVANPRPQKRLPFLVAVLAATRDEMARRGARRRVELVIAGGGSRASDRAVLDEVREAARLLSVEGDLRLAGSVEDVAGLLAAADVMVSSSAFEGLSLAHVEALASGLPLVATAAGGTPELARDNPAAVLVPTQAPSEIYAAAIAEIAAAPPTGGREAAGDQFNHGRMAPAVASR